MNLIGSSPPMQRVLSMVRHVAPTKAAVLISGESGTGKELVSRAIHELSPRFGGPFVAVNCAALPETLIESELFGHEKGAFTGAVERRAGCFELAQNGTLLLDELAEMSAVNQAKLLRVLEDSHVRRLGTRSEIPVDVRVIAATSKNPDDAIHNGQLRCELYYRLNVFHITLPPLRARKEDLPQLSEALIRDLNRKHACNVTEVGPDVMERFHIHSWPGNVRELRNVLERAVIMAGAGPISARHLPHNFCAADVSGTARQPIDPDNVILSFGITIREAERALIQFTLKRTDNNKTRAAEMLGISLKTLFNKIKQYKAAETSKSLAATS